ncbi:MAG: hypothetical protein LDL51_12405, partial [Chloroflexi bacterium]|nr:hypothetical protein [Chloroflexota bacterium]
IIIDQAVKETLTFTSDHNYSYEKMGFTREQIVEMYADIFERFGFDAREPFVEREKVEVETTKKAS